MRDFLSHFTPKGNIAKINLQVEEGDTCQSGRGGILHQIHGPRGREQKNSHNP